MKRAGKLELMAPALGQTSGAMLTLLLESQLASSRLSPPAPFPARLQGASAPKETTAQSTVLGYCCRPASYCGAKNVCFMNELGLGDP